MLAEELTVLDGDSQLWQAARPLLNAALRLEQNDESYCWYGWNRRRINTFLQGLPAKCSVIIGVWEIVSAAESNIEHERLTLGIVCEVIEGEVCSIRTFETLTKFGLKHVEQLEPGIEDALEIMCVVRAHIAPIAWALFTDKATWNEWLFATAEDGGLFDKGELLASLARQGRCVLMGSRTAHAHHD